MLGCKSNIKLSHAPFLIQNYNFLNRLAALTSLQCCLGATSCFFTCASVASVQSPTFFLPIFYLTTLVACYKSL